LEQLSPSTTPPFKHDDGWYLPTSSPDPYSEPVCILGPSPETVLSLVNLFFFSSFFVAGQLSFYDGSKRHEKGDKSNWNGIGISKDG
jgi:hypothetical protein